MSQMIALPAIEIRPEPVPWLPFDADDDLLPSLIAWLGRARGSLDYGVGEAVATLVAEGRRFRETESGQRWNAMLENSDLVANGWMVWNMLDMDRHLTGRDAASGQDTPAQLIEEMLRQLQAAKIEELVGLANSLWGKEAGHA